MLLGVVDTIAHYSCYCTVHSVQVHVYHHTLLLCIVCYTRHRYHVHCVTTIHSTHAAVMCTVLPCLYACMLVPDTTHTTYTTGHVVSHNTLVLLQHT